MKSDWPPNTNSESAQLASRAPARSAGGPALAGANVVKTLTTH
jgi:hypothetical protein